MKLFEKKMKLVFRKIYMLGCINYKNVYIKVDGETKTKESNIGKIMNKYYKPFDFYKNSESGP